MRVLVTGGTGFVGHQLVRELEERGYDVAVLARPGSDRSALEGRRAEVREGSLFDAADVERACAGCEGVFHVAGDTSWYRGDRARVRRVNVAGTVSVLEGARRAGVRRVVHTSTQAAVGVTDDPKRPADEDTAFNWPAWMPYPQAKREAERYALSAPGVEVVCVNPPSISGPGDLRANMAQLYQGVRDGKLPRVSRGGFNMVDVRDVAIGHVLAFERGAPGRRYILAGDDVDFPDFLERMRAAIPGAPAARGVPAAGVRILSALLRVLEPFGVRADAAAGFLWCMSRYLYISSARAKAELGYAPRPLDDTIRDSVAWYRQAGMLS